MKRAYKYRFYPTPAQEFLLRRTFGCRRKVWNLALAMKKEAYDRDKTSISPFDLMKMLPVWKKDPRYAYLNEVPAVVLQQAIADLGTAYKNFFDSCSGKRKGTKVCYPRFKNRNSRRSARFVGLAIVVRDGGVYLAKMKEPLDIVLSRPFPEGQKPSSVTVSLDSAGRWFVSLLFTDEVEPADMTGAVVGIDLGLKTFAVTSDGEEIDHPKILARHAKRLARYQRRYARTQKGSRNREKARVRVAKVHAKVADTRKDFLQQTTTRLVREYDIIAIEDLNVAGMKKNRRLAKSISDSGWSSFRTMLEYKTEWYGKRIIVIDRFHPSSRLCSDCGWKNNQLKLSDRSWTCLECGTLHDRDLNAAKNILAAGLAVVQRELDKACGEEVRPKKTPRVSPLTGRQTSTKQEPTESAASAA